MKSGLTDVLAATLDRLPQQIAVVDGRADIVWVNRSWVEFGLDNGGDAVDWTGVNYFDPSCSAVTDGETTAMVGRLRGVVSGTSDEYGDEYPCFSPTEHRWFRVNARAFSLPDARFVVMSHDDVTARHVAEHQANTDVLTGLANRRAFEEFLERHWFQAMRLSLPISVLSVDVDDFKQHNDLLGHDGGDRVLGELARALEDECRRSVDLAARVGGDEFAAVLADTDVDVAQEFAESLRARFTDRVQRSVGVKATVSIGAATETPAIGVAFGGLMRRADASLMEAKRTGRDRVVVDPGSIDMATGGPVDPADPTDDRQG